MSVTLLVNTFILEPIWQRENNHPMWPIKAELTLIPASICLQTQTFTMTLIVQEVTLVPEAVWSCEHPFPIWQVVFPLTVIFTSIRQLYSTCAFLLVFYVVTIILVSTHLLIVAISISFVVLEGSNVLATIRPNLGPKTVHLAILQVTSIA